jgi:hypothetical protein
MIQDLYFIDLAKSSQVLLTLLLHLPMDDSHFGCPKNKKNPQNKSLFNLHIIQTPHEQIISQACKIIVILSISNFTTHFQTPAPPQNPPYLKYLANKRKFIHYTCLARNCNGQEKKAGRNYGQEQGRKTGRNKGQENEQEHGQ